MPSTRHLANTHVATNASIYMLGRRTQLSRLCGGNGNNLWLQSHDSTVGYANLTPPCL